MMSRVTLSVQNRRLGNVALNLPSGDLCDCWDPSCLVHPGSGQWEWHWQEWTCRSRVSHTDKMWGSELSSGNAVEAQCPSHDGGFQVLRVDLANRLLREEKRSRVWGQGCITQGNKETGPLTQRSPHWWPVAGKGQNYPLAHSCLLGTSGMITNQNVSFCSPSGLQRWQHQSPESVTYPGSCSGSNIVTTVFFKGNQEGQN